MGLCLVLAAAGFLSATAITVHAVPSATSAAPSDSFGLPNLTRRGLVLPMGNSSAPDGLQVGHPAVLADGSIYRMWYFEVATSWYCQVAYATSVDGKVWTKLGAVLWPTLPDEGHNTAYPSVVRVNGTYWMFYDGTPNIDASDYRIFAATSPDGVNWTKLGVVLDLGPPGSPDGISLLYPHVLFVNGTFDLWYTGLSSLTPPGNGAIMLAQSTNGLNWTKQGIVLSNGTAGSLDSYNAVAGSVAVLGSTYVMVYDGETGYLTSNLLYALSGDAVHWTKMGLALPRDPPRESYLAQPDLVVLPDGTWNLYYVVRNYTSDLQIYLAAGTPGAASSSPSPSPAPGKASAPSSGSLAFLTSWAPPAVAVPVLAGLGALGGAGFFILLRRKRPRLPV